jgi:CPA1 family monovalent cation:H+ antiporter
VKIWQILLIVGLGIGYGIIEPGRLTYAFGQATLYIFLPPLLFEAAWNLHYRAIVRQWRAIAALVVPGVLLTALIIAGALAVVRVPFGPALLTGAILSGTDPIAVVAVFKRIRVPKTLSTIVECESLFNDAVCVVLYRAVLLVLAIGADTRAIAAITAFAIVRSIGGVLLGVLIAIFSARVLRERTVAAQIVVTILCAYGSYFVAEELHCSGIFATIASGIALRYFERRWLSLTIAEDVNRFWDLSALVANVLVFFLVGAALRLSDVARDPLFVFATLVGVAFSRIAVAGLLLPAGFPREWLDVIRVAGLRGALSLALALAVPSSIPYRDVIIAATFAATLATLIAGSATVPRVVARAARARSG